MKNYSSYMYYSKNLFFKVSVYCISAINFLNIVIHLLRARGQLNKTFTSVIYKWVWPLSWGDVTRDHLTWDQASIFFFGFFGSRGKKNNAWYIYLTSSQPPPNLHNLTFAWPVMFLANKRLPNGNQILARIMSLLKSVLGKKIF